ncbi:MBL fold metallo-hydrolase [Desmonostoc muscorum LEGE 12446]|uniref:MBL fold metallo-hydrolase n=1 Tax=Desmonostoc muscorum LEGE 12446 TaxID=1828758 RepID=A0A8J6ZLJ8_DESMC|nr:MBL fold metallo-hydrolase [Desmonostoc muscorum]MCF2147143.1 MBL fold metallo-hydrolase [Desmonostoc muscorum LEGE 12446]
MEIHMIGHASIFVETQDCKILMDPVLWDPHCEGMEEVFPTREVIHERIPEFDLLIISHRHLDHFDVRSLAYLPKTVDVLIPKDKILETCLRKLGYSQIYPLGDFSEVKIGSTNILTTRSEYRLPEYGIVFADKSGVFWNQVDSDVSTDTIRFVKSRYPQVDFLLALWQPMLESNYQCNESLSFPYSSYNKLLRNISRIKPRAIAPGSNGFKLINESSWLNQILFPVTREQFCRDVRMVCPEIKENVFTLDPGDILAFKNGEFSYLKEMSQFVNKMDDNRESLDFSPVKVGANLIDKNHDNYNLNEMKEAIEQEVNINLTKFLQDNKDSLFLEHCHWNVIYQLEVVFPDSSYKWSFDFSKDNIQACLGRNTFANLFTIITASSFYGLLKQIKGWDYVYISGYYRRFKKIYLATNHGIIKPNEGEIEDPLIFRFPYKEIFDVIRHKEVEKWKQPIENSSFLDESKTLMMKIGNTLVRLSK